MKYWSFNVYLIISIFLISCNNNIRNQIESIQYDNGIIEFQGSLLLKDGNVEQSELHKTNVRYYDKSGRVLIIEYSDGEKNYSLFRKNGEGAIMMEIIYNDKYERVWRNEYLYYEDGNVKSINSFNKSEKLESKTLMAYDTKGNRISTETYNSDSTLNNRTVNEYDGTKLIKSSFYIANDDPVENIYIYNNYGLLIKCDSYKYGKIISTTEYSEYDQNRRVVLTINYVYDGKNKRIPSTINKFQYFNLTIASTG